MKIKISSQVSRDKLLLGNISVRSKNAFNIARINSNSDRFK